MGFDIFSSADEPSDVKMMSRSMGSIDRSPTVSPDAIPGIATVIRIQLRGTGRGRKLGIPAVQVRPRDTSPYRMYPPVVSSSNSDSASLRPALE